MFKSFFPNPKVLFLSALAWSLFAVLFWMFAARDWGTYIGLPNPAEGTPPIIGARSLFTAPHMYFYIYFFACAGAFALFWKFFSPHPWYRWSVLGSIFLVFLTYFQVQISIAINDWYGEFYNLIQKALDSKTKGTVTAGELYGSFNNVIWILFLWITVIIFVSFFASHYVFRWRTAMTVYYTEHWQNLRKVEGASQRVQEDTMRFARLIEDLGVSFVNAVMTLIAFLPVLSALSVHVPTIPFIGEVPNSLVVVSLVWSLFGTGFIALLGFKLPGLEFGNQRVEAALRKELVYGEDNADRARPPTVAELFGNVRKNYFKLYWNYLYFNFGRYLFIQADAFLAAFIMIPSISIAAVGFSFGVFRQVSSAMGEVRDAMQYLFKSWPSIIELISIFKRLRLFESAIDGDAHGDIEADELYGAKQT
jgi:peptide/bleomycin uptake transporter